MPSGGDIVNCKRTQSQCHLAKDGRITRLSRKGEWILFWWDFLHFITVYVMFIFSKMHTRSRRYYVLVLINKKRGNPIWEFKIIDRIPIASLLLRFWLMVSVCKWKYAKGCSVSFTDQFCGTMVLKFDNRCVLLLCSRDLFLLSFDVWLLASMLASKFLFWWRGPWNSTTYTGLEGCKIYRVSLCQV